MSRTRFQEIRSSIHFTSNASYGNKSASSDPLWSFRSLIDQFIQKPASIAVPLGALELDENSCPLKTRTKAKTYSSNKPAKYAILFYAVVGHRFCYLSSMFDNVQIIQQEYRVYMIIAVSFALFILLITRLLGMISLKIPWLRHHRLCGYV
jgi:hypothetical protein